MAATTQQTIEYAFPTNETSLAATTRFDFAAITLNIPETTSRLFRSVIVRVTGRENDVAATSITAWLIGINLDAVGFNDATVTDTLNNTGESSSFILTRDVTSYFVTNFGTGTSQTCQVGVLFTGGATINCSVKLIITYEYDDTAHTTTRIKTVKIPIESATGALTTTLVEIGTNQVPNLDTLLPEASKTYRAKFFQVMSNEVMGATGTDYTLNLALDAESADATGTIEAGLLSSCYMDYIWLRDDMTTSATHAFKLAVSSTTGATHNHAAIVLVVTYEYNDSTSSSYFNSVQIPVNLSGGVGGTASGDQQVVRFPVSIQEPTTLTLVQSGVQIFFDAFGAVVSPNVAIGGQTARAYTHSVGGVSCGQFTLLQRFDASAAQGSGLSIARGLNNIDIKQYSSDSTDYMHNCTALIYLNYTSGKATAGSKNHKKTVVYSKWNTAANTDRLELTTGTPNITPVIPEANYWLDSVGFDLTSMTSNSTISTMGSLPVGALFAEVASGEGPADGWIPLMHNTVHSAQEMRANTNFCDATQFFRQYPNDPDTVKMDVEVARKYRIVSGVAPWLSMMMYVTYHTISYSITGNITGSAGGTVNISAYLKPPGQPRMLIDTTSRSGNGTYSITWYDNVLTGFAEAREDATHVGRSDDSVAS